MNIQQNFTQTTVNLTWENEQSLPQSKSGMIFHRNIQFIDWGKAILIKSIVKI